MHVNVAVSQVEIHWAAEQAIAKLNELLAVIDPFELTATRTDVLICMGSLDILQNYCRRGKLVPRAEPMALWDDEQ